MQLSWKKVCRKNCHKQCYVIKSNMIHSWRIKHSIGKIFFRSVSFLKSLHKLDWTCQLYWLQIDHSHNVPEYGFPGLEKVSPGIPTALCMSSWLAFTSMSWNAFFLTSNWGNALLRLQKQVEISFKKNRICYMARDLHLRSTIIHRSGGE